MQIANTSFVLKNLMKSPPSGINLHCCPIGTRISTLMNTMWLSSLFGNWYRVKNSVHSPHPCSACQLRKLSLKCVSPTCLACLMCPSHSTWTNSAFFLFINASSYLASSTNFFWPWSHSHLFFFFYTTLNTSLYRYYWTVFVNFVVSFLL